MADTEAKDKELIADHQFGFLLDRIDNLNRAIGEGKRAALAECEKIVTTELKSIRRTMASIVEKQNCLYDEQKRLEDRMNTAGQVVQGLIDKLPKED